MPLASILTQLENDQLIRAIEEADAAYIFKNVMSQQAAYQSLLTKNRRELHRCVAETYEKLYADQLDEIAVLLAQHYAEAGDDAKTFAYCLRAGNSAMRVYANAEALQFFTRALEIARRHTAETNAFPLREAYMNCGRIFELSGNYDAALKNYEEMETLGHTRGDASMELDAIIALATLRSTPTTLYDSTLGQSLSDWGIKVAREAGDRAAEAKILWNLMNLCFFTLRPQEGIAHGERALAIARELGLTERIAYILNDINRLYLSMGEIDKAQQSVMEARELWRTLNNLPMLADNFGSGAEIGQFSYDLDRSFADSQQAVDLARSIDNPWTLSYALASQAFVLHERGEMDRAFEIAWQSVEHAQQAGFAAGMDIGRSEISIAYGYLGAIDRGIELIGQVLEGMAASFVMFRPWIRSYAARLYIRKGRLTDAEAILNEARTELSPTTPIIYLAIPITMVSAELAFAQNEYIRVIETTQTLIERSEQQGVRIMLLDALILQGRAYLALNDLDHAEQVMETARARAQAAGSRRTLWEILLGLSRVARARGQIARAEKWRDEARAVITFILEHLGDKELRDLFLNLPDVREVTD